MPGLSSLLFSPGIFARRTSRALMVIAFLFLLGVCALTVFLFNALTQEARTIRASDRQVLQQAGSEIHKLQISLERFEIGRDQLDDLLLHYDIVYSRAKTLETERVHASLKKAGLSDEHSEVMARLVKNIYKLDALFLNLQSPADRVFEQIRSLTKLVQTDWEELSLLFFQRVVDRATEEKEQQILISGALGVGLLVLISCVMSLIYILIRQSQWTERALVRERHLTSQLVATTKAVEAASEAKSSFLHTMSHELRTPLNAICGFSELLKDTKLDDGQKQYLAYVLQSSNHLSELIGDILDYVEIKADEFEFSPTWVETNDMMSDLKIFLIKHIEQENKKLRLRIQMDAEVPATFQTDYLQLSRILNHLGMNAIKFSDEGDIIIRVKVKDANLASPFLRLEFEDFGIGIPDDLQQPIFEVFSQADQSYARKYEGSGMGLAICKTLVEKLHGHIGVSSEVGVGSLFWVEIPLQYPANEKAD